MNKPVYRSMADSFRLDIYMPERGMSAAPVATCMADGQLAEKMASARPPQSVLMNVNEALEVAGAGSLDACMRLIAGKAVPIVRFETEAAGRRIAGYVFENCIGDVTLCVPYEKRSMLPVIRSLLPLSRGMLDARGCRLPELAELVGQVYESDATMLLVKDGMNRALSRSLQKRFVQVWLEASDDIPGALTTGVCGVLTQDTDGLYDLIDRFPAASTVRPAPLYAHKAYHVTGEYPENSISACKAAGERGYDATEIDIQLTKDDVLVVQHDRDTKNLFTEDMLVSAENWENVKKLRRKAFPAEGIDRMDDLMRAMAAYPETPVLIELKTTGTLFGVEEGCRQMKALFERDDTQKACTCIMGAMPPYLDYVHRMIPQLPVAHCTGGNYTASTDMDENNKRIYRLALDTRGANAGYNPYLQLIGREFGELAHVRGITVFPWTLAFVPWEQDGEAVTNGFLAGFDGLTSDWVVKFSHVPLDVRAELPETWKAGQPMEVQYEMLMRSGEWVTAQGSIEIVSPDEDVAADEAGRITAGAGVKRIIPGVRTELEGGKSLCVFGASVSVRFE